MRRLVLERRSHTPLALTLASPLLAVALTMLSATLIFAVMGHDPLNALYIYFVLPLSDAWGLQEVAVKATPLAVSYTHLTLPTKRIV